MTPNWKNLRFAEVFLCLMDDVIMSDFFICCLPVNLPLHNNAT